MHLEMRKSFFCPHFQATQSASTYKKFVDVTLVVEHQLITAHRIMLIAFSPYFEEHFSNQPDDGTLHEVTLQGVRADSVKALIQYMYTGEVTVSRDQLFPLLKTALFLKMEGFDMEAQEEDVSISKMSILSSNPNNNWATNETVIKKETDEPDKVEAVGNSDDNRLLVANPPKIGAIKKELMDFEDQFQETTDTEELMMCDSVGIESHLNHLPNPIFFKRRYSDDDEAAAVDDVGKNEEILVQRHQIIDQSPECDGRSEISGHYSLNDEDVNPIIDSSDEDTSPGSMVGPSQILENQQDLGLPPKKRASYSKALKTVPERPFKCTNNCGRSYKRKSNLNRHLKYECGKQPHFLCTQCEQQFFQKEHLRAHLTNIHKIDRSQHESFFAGQKLRPTYDFKCDRCERSYSRKDNLLRHRNKECGVEPSFACTHCDYRTAHYSTLKTHITNVHG